MARQPRFFVSGHPLHVILRGNNRQRIFVTDRDYRFFLACLIEAVGSCGVAVHAYVFMTNHVHLLVTPRSERSLPTALQSVGRRYVQYFNRAHQRTGTLWEGRYRATIVDTDRYLLACMRYIELNPVRAGMVHDPGAHLWSSYRANVEGAPDALVTPHPLYGDMSSSPRQRQAAYRALFDQPLPPSEIDAIRSATNRNWALGTDAFKEQIERLSGRRSVPSRRGPEPKSSTSTTGGFQADPEAEFRV